VKLVNGVARYSIDDPADLKVLVHSPTFWRSAGPNSQDAAVEYLAANPTEVDPAVVPAQYMAMLQPAEEPTSE
jgi:hypothetical protein